jgi:hypothetical protein
MAGTDKQWSLCGIPDLAMGFMDGLHLRRERYPFPAHESIVWSAGVSILGERKERNLRSIP